jgi:hypothetical protein
MKYIIEDKQLFDAIYKFIDNMLTEDNIRYQHGYNYDTDKSDENLLNFYGDKYSNNEQDDWYFEYVSREFYENLTFGREWENTIKEKWLNKSPVLEFMDTEFISKLDGFFSSFWKPVFEQWFRDKFPHLPVKTFVY